MTLARLDDPVVSFGGLGDLRRHHPPQAVRTPPALHQRLHAPQAVASRQEGCPRALRAPRAPLSAPLPAGVLASLGRVFLDESPPWRLHEQRADAVPGAGGRASRSRVQSDGSDAVRAPRRQDRAGTDGQGAEQGHAAAVVSPGRAGDRVSRDCGDGRVDIGGQSAAPQAGLLRRCSNRVAGYPSAADPVPALAWVAHVRRRRGRRGTWRVLPNAAAP